MSQVPCKNTANFVETVIEDEAVLMNIGNGDFFSLAGTALAIWNLIDGSRDVPQIVAALAEQYGAPASEVATDVEAFVVELAQLDFIVHG
ncbi:MAG: PqqD family protein [Sphingomonadales bacterium]|nr:PqqD family protein [Sphingomonadales bacterium]